MQCALATALGPLIVSLNIILPIPHNTVCTPFKVLKYKRSIKYTFYQGLFLTREITESEGWHHCLIPRVLAEFECCLRL